MSLSRATRTVFAALVTIGLTACSGGHSSSPSSYAAMQPGATGRAMGGEQPITGAAVYLYKVGTDFVGEAATPILNAPVTTSDGTGIGGDASNDNNQMAPGFFTITNDYDCNPSNALVYMATVGGNPGGGENSSQVNLVALGDCTALKSTPFVVVNEITTVGTMAALYPFMQEGGALNTGSNYDTIGSDDPTALAAAFNKAAMYMDAANGVAPGPKLPAGYDASSNDLRALANAVQSCVNSVSSQSSLSSTCQSLFDDTFDNFNSDAYEALDTPYALWNEFAHHPNLNVSQIFDLQSGIPPFTPTNVSAPTDWSLPILPVPNTPTFSPSPSAGTIDSTQAITISDSDATAVIYYTTDGSTPTASSSTYAGPIYLTSSATVKALAIESGHIASSVGSASYTIHVVAAAAPTFSPGTGTYTTGQTVALSSTTPGAHYYYTTDGSTPTTASAPYTGPIAVNASATINAVAYAPGYGLSPVSSATYVIQLVTHTITTVVGSGLQTYSGDNVYATDAQLYLPRAVVLHNGYLYISDAQNGVIRKVDLNSNIITRVATTGSQAYGMNFDSAGNLYYTEWAGNRVRKVDANTGAITLVLGAGPQGFAGDGAAADTTNTKLNSPWGIVLDSDGNIYIADYSNNRIRMVYYGGTTGANLIALEHPGTTATAGYIYTIAGSGSTTESGDGSLAINAGISGPSDMCLDSSGNIVFAEYNGQTVRKIDKTTGNISTIAGHESSYDTADGVLATASGVYLGNPSGISYDASGNLYIAEFQGRIVRKVSASTGIISTVAGRSDGGGVEKSDGGLATNASLHNPANVAADSNGVLYIAEFESNVSVEGVNFIRKVDTSGIISTLAGSGAQRWGGGLGGPALQAEMYFPEGVALDPSGNLFIADSAMNRILKVDASTGYFTLYAGISSQTPRSGGNGVATSIGLANPHGVATDTHGNVYVADTQNHVIRKVDTTGNSTVVAGMVGQPGESGGHGLATAATLFNPYAVSVDAAGNMFIADNSNNCIREVTASDSFIKTVAGICDYTAGLPNYGGDGGSATAAKMRNPSGVTVSADDDIYVSDTNSERIRLIYNGGAAAANLLIAQGQTPVVGNIYTIAGNGFPSGTPLSGPPVSAGDGGLGNASGAYIGYPKGVALDSMGNVYFATQSISSGTNGNERIRRIDAVTGIITTYVNSTGIGNNNVQYLSGDQIGDGGSASGALLTLPMGVTFDSHDNLYIGDACDRRVRMVAH